MDAVAKKMSKASSAQDGVDPPKEGEHFRCAQCGMEIEVTVACDCQNGQHAQFQCCGQDLEKV